MGQVQLGGPLETIFFLADDILRRQRQVETSVAHLTDVTVDLGIARRAADIEVTQQVLRMVVIPVKVYIKAVEQL